MPPENKNKPDKKEQKQDFAWFVNNVHPLVRRASNKKPLDLAKANEYADRGVAFLRSLLPQENNDENANTEKFSKDTANCILWALMRAAYQNKYVSSKVMFNLIFSEDPLENDRIVKKLTSILAKYSYNRLSSHYPQESNLILKKAKVSTAGGIDIDRGKVPYPANFETLLFKRIHLKDGRLALAIKPETRSADLKRPLHAAAHMVNWYESSKNRSDRTFAGTQAFREKFKKRNKEYLENPALQGSELIFRVSSKGKRGFVQEPSHRLVPRRLGVSKRDLDVV